MITLLRTSVDEKLKSTTSSASMVVILQSVKIPPSSARLDGKEKKEKIRSEKNHNGFFFCQR